MKVESYKTQIIRTETGKYFGELWVNNKLYQKTAYFANEAIATLRLNKRIENFNAMENTKIQPYQKDAETNQFPAAPKESAVEKEVVIAKLQGLTRTQPKINVKTTTPRRKPFTPYGLNGYFVDKQGNIRLHLDRKAHAHTIVLNPEMFSMLANMVQATQEQNNETHNAIALAMR
jgi:genome